MSIISWESGKTRKIHLLLGNTSHKKNQFLSGIAQITSPAPPLPQFRQVVQLFLDVKNCVLTRITEPSTVITTMMGVIIAMPERFFSFLREVFP